MRASEHKQNTPWSYARARFLFREVVERNHNLPLASVTKDGGVEFRDDLDISVWNPGEDVSSYKRVIPGDFVIGLRSFQSGIGFSKIAGLVSPAYTVLRPIDQIEHRYYKHFFKSDLFISQLENVAQGIRQGRTISTESFYNLRLPIPSKQKQRAIADFLDAETARIDALIEKKRRMHSAIEERFKSERDQRVRGLMADHGSTTVRRLVDGVEQGWSPSCENLEADADEWGVLKTSAVTQGVFIGVENKRLPDDLQPDLRWVVKDDDVLVARGSGSIKRVGTAAVAATGGRKLTISDLIYRLVRPRMNAALLAHCINSSIGRTHLESSIRTDVGQTLKIRGDDLLDTPVPGVASKLQAAALEEVERRRHIANETVERLSAQIELLTEHRQALITAAVTGQVEVPGAFC